MNAKTKIRKALSRIMDEGEANACAIWKGYDMGTHRDGWHYVPFGRTAVYMGKSVGEALEFIEQVKEEREMNW